jgi:hypothetical protein
MAWLDLGNSQLDGKACGGLGRISDDATQCMSTSLGLMGGAWMLTMLGSDYLE